MKIDRDRKSIVFDNLVEFTRNATSELLIVLAERWLEGAGKGLDPLDYPLVNARKLCQILGLESEESVRKRINRSRKYVKTSFESAGINPDTVADLIENIPWGGYRLNPQMVTVKVKEC